MGKYDIIAEIVRKEKGMIYYEKMPDWLH